MSKTPKIIVTPNVQNDQDIQNDWYAQNDRYCQNSSSNERLCCLEKTRQIPSLANPLAAIGTTASFGLYYLHSIQINQNFDITF